MRKSTRPAAINLLSMSLGGGVTYAQNFLAYWVSERPTESLLVFGVRSHPLFQQFSHPAIKFFLFPRFRPTFLFRLFFEQIIVPIILLKYRARVIFCPADVAVFLAPCPVLLAQRNQIIYRPERTTWIGSDVIRLSVLNILANVSTLRATRVFHVSKTSSREIAESLFVPLPDHKKSINYHGVKKFNLSKAPINDQHSEFIIGFVSTLYPYKDLATVVNSLRFLPSDLGARRIKLLIAGNELRKGYVESLIKHVSTDLDKNIIVEHRDFLSSHAVEQIYDQLHVSVFASRVETFGHPIIEALSAGVPLIAADTAINREISGGNAYFFAPGDAFQLSRIIEACVRSSEFRKRYIADARDHAKNFCWKISFDNVFSEMAKFPGSQAPNCLS